MKQQVKIKTPNGVGVIEDITVSELGFLMLRVYLENGEEKRWSTYNLGIHDVNNNMFTNELFKDMPKPTEAKPNEWDYAGWHKYLEPKSDNLEIPVPYESFITQKDWNQTLMTMLNQMSLMIPSHEKSNYKFIVGSNLNEIIKSLGFYNGDKSTYRDFKFEFTNTLTNIIRFENVNGDTLNELVIINNGPITGN